MENNNQQPSQEQQYNHAPGNPNRFDGGTVNPSHDPANYMIDEDGEKVYVGQSRRGKPQTRNEDEVSYTRIYEGNQYKNGKVDDSFEAFLKQNPLGVEHENPADLPPVRTNQDRARKVGSSRSPEEVKQILQDEEEAIRHFEERTQAEQFIADYKASNLSPQFIYSQIEALKADKEAQEFIANYDPDKDPVNWTPELRDLFERTAKMFGSTRFENSSNPGTSRRELMAMIKLGGLDSGGVPQQQAQQDRQAFYQREEQQLRQYWGVNDSELRRRIGLTKAIADAFANAEERKFIAQNPAEASAQTWDELQNNPEFVQRCRDAGIKI